MADNSKIVMGPNQWGKAEVRLVHINHNTARHEIEDVKITSRLHGDLDAAHMAGDNAHMTPTDTQKNTIFAFAKDGIGSIEEFLIRLGKHFVALGPIAGGRWDAEQYSWSRITVDGAGHEHSFVRSGTETRTTAVTISDEGETFVVSGLRDLVVLKSGGSQFTGFPVDQYTTLQEATDRILATSVTARWRYTTNELDFNATFEDVRDTLLEVFATHYSYSLQNSLYEMGKRVLEKHPEIAEIKFSMPNKHHFVVDFEPFGLENDNEVFFAADRPYGIIEGTVLREGASTAPAAWEGIAGFC
ncbi:MAG: factor-independent urate hydroxylase [Microbacteriaceae bacterium]